MKILNKHRDRIPKDAVFCGWGSALGNPYQCGVKPNPDRIQCASREEAIDKYRHWLWKKIQAGDRRVLLALFRLDDNSTLWCYCVPLPCHCEVIEKAWNWLMDELAKERSEYLERWQSGLSH